MRNCFRITCYAVNKRGLTVGIGYQVTTSNTKSATVHAMLQALRLPYVWLASGFFRRYGRGNDWVLITILDGVDESIEHVRVSGEVAL